MAITRELKSYAIKFKTKIDEEKSAIITVSGVNPSATNEQCQALIEATASLFVHNYDNSYYPRRVGTYNLQENE